MLILSVIVIGVLVYTQFKQSQKIEDISDDNQQLRKQINTLNQEISSLQKQRAALQAQSRSDQDQIYQLTSRLEPLDEYVMSLQAEFDQCKYAYFNLQLKLFNSFESLQQLEVFEHSNFKTNELVARIFLINDLFSKSLDIPASSSTSKNQKLIAAAEQYQLVLNEFIALRQRFIDRINKVIEVTNAPIDPYYSEFRDSNYRHVRNTLIGESVEDIVRNQFKEALPKDEHLILHSLNLKYQEDTTQIDLIVINRWGVYIYEIKSSLRALKMSWSKQQEQHKQAVVDAIVNNSEDIANPEVFRKWLLDGGKSRATGVIQTRYLVMDDKLPDNERYNDIPVLSCESAIAELQNPDTDCEPPFYNMKRPNEYKEILNESNNQAKDHRFVVPKTDRQTIQSIADMKKFLDWTEAGEYIDV